jgi:uncharacterized membrane protein
MLTQQSLWNDEGWSLHFSEGTSWQEVFSRLRRTSFADRFQPLYFLILYGWRSVLGDAEFTLRFLSVLCGLAAIIVFFFAGLRIYGKRRAWWSLLIAAVSAYLIYYSQEVRPYAFLILLVSVQLYLFSRALDENATSGAELRWRILFGMVTGLSIFANIFMAIFSVALCVSYAFVYRHPKRWVQWWVPAVFFALPAVAFHVSASLASDPTKVWVNRLVQPIIQNALFVPYGLLVGTSFGPPMEQLRGADRIQVVFSYWPQLLVFALVCIMMFGLLLLVLRRRSHDNEHAKADYFFLFILPISVVFYILFTIVANFNWQPRHSFFLYFPIAFLISVFFEERQKSNSSRSKILMLGRILVIVFIILNAYSLSHYFFDKSYARDDYRSVAKYLQENHHIPSVILYGRPILLKYYGYKRIIDGTNFRTENLADEIMKTTENAHTVFIVVNREFYWEKYNEGFVKESMNKLYRKTDQVSYHYFNIYTFQRKI